LGTYDGVAGLVAQLVSGAADTGILETAYGLGRGVGGLPVN
jgi:hypothetical protein